MWTVAFLLATRKTPLLSVTIRIRATLTTIKGAVNDRPFLGRNSHDFVTLKIEIVC